MKTTDATEEEYEGPIKVTDKRIPVSREINQEMSMVAVLDRALTKNYPPETIREMMTLAQEWERNEARKAYHLAMSRFKANPPEILKDRHVKYQAGGQTIGYDHASLANVTQKINEGLSKEELSAAWTTKQENGHISVTCKITHAMGHGEETTLTAAPDASGSKNSIQAIGSTVSYLQRYTLLSLTGLATTDQDDDGQGSEEAKMPISKKQLSTLTDMIDNTDTNKEKFLQYFGIEDLKDLPADRFNEAMKLLRAKKKD